MASYALSIGRESLYLVLVLAGPPVLAAMVVGLMVSLLQATTQVQEQTLTFVPKMVMVVVILATLGPIGMGQLLTFTETLFSTFHTYIK